AHVDAAHELAPHRPGVGPPLRVGDDLARQVEAEPDRTHQVRGEADEPDVGAVVGGAGLAGGGDGVGEVRAAAPAHRVGGGAVVDHVAQHGGGDRRHVRLE